ncbi:MAG: hypothetical protein R3Y21_02020 [Mycoplasmatota bacterium]
MQESGFWSGIVRGMFGILDELIYWAIEAFYGIFIEITNISVLSQDTISSFAGRIYVFLGFIMLFKVTFSLIQMFLNPDTLTGDKGAGKLIQKIIIMLILLVSVPTIFNTAYTIQSIILDNNILGNLIMGATTSSTAADSFDEMGSTISGSIMAGFFYTDDSSGLVEFSCSGATTNCFNDVNRTSSTNGYYDYYYHPIISTLAGILVAWIILMFTFDVAIRSAKLAFLQIIAPIPIISSIDPKGQKTFDNWVQTCIKTYLDVFVRLIIIFFVVFIISEIVQGGVFSVYDATTGEAISDLNPFTGAWIIVGLLLFAKEAPKLLGDMLGIKLDGGFTMNPFKRVAEVPFLGKGAASVLGGADALVHKRSFADGFMKTSKNFKLLGNDGKTSIFETADRVARRDAAKKDLENAYSIYGGRRELKEMNKSYDIGKAANDIESYQINNQKPNSVSIEAGDLDPSGNLNNNKRTTLENNYKKIGFKSGEYITSAINYNTAKKNSEVTQIDLRKANSELSIAESVLANNPNDANAISNVASKRADMEIKQEAYEKAKKTEDGRKATHDVMGKMHAKDARLEKAMKVAKGPRPTAKK